MSFRLQEVSSWPWPSYPKVVIKGFVCIIFNSINLSYCSCKVRKLIEIILVTHFSYVQFKINFIQLYIEEVKQVFYFNTQNTNACDRLSNLISKLSNDFVVIIEYVR